ncbi:ScbR family autoregulator-binding transcription factor [Streptomyces boluensis]|uniref:TetR family transcriptional regulator n=1 Tax=Streptomyces boluensis TaxID=1775135 RepID=A0A964UU59_9ACTN|nr:ScbR family autoregulator-binding transcription factor [Streptomyces boluensis]NBE54455.1 TetR family transcriptional regulator [Streptomyces boluensis]
MARQDRALRTRQALIRAAAEVFAHEGFAPASLTTISRQAGVSNGALHFHFGNKSALAQAVEDEAAQTLHRITQQVTLDDRDPLRELVDATHELSRRLADDIVVRAGFELCGDAARGGVAELRHAWRQWVEDTLRRAERDGRLAEEVSADTAAVAVVAATVGLGVLGSRDQEWLSEQSVTRLWSLLLPGLVTPRDTPTPQPL